MIRPATEADIPFLRDSFSRNVILEPYTDQGSTDAFRLFRAVFDYLFKAQGSKTVVEEIDDNLLGWAGAINGRFWWCYVKAPYRGNGIGRKLIEAVAPTGADKIVMTVFPTRYGWRWMMEQQLLPIWDYQVFYRVIKDAKKKKENT